jgi:hypothetical protein
MMMKLCCENLFDFFKMPWPRIGLLIKNGFCSRYLRARRFNPEEAFTQFKDTEEWRKDNHLEQYYDKIDIHEYDAARRLVCHIYNVYGNF